MKKILIIALALATLGACKKDKDGPKVYKANTALVNYLVVVQNQHSMTWYTAGDFTYHSMDEILKSKTLQHDVLFGFYKNNNTYGLYAPVSYPHEYGQKHWEVKNTTTFKTAKLSMKEFKARLDKSEPITPEYIDQAYNEGTGGANFITNLNSDELYVFESKNGQLRGIIKVIDLDQPGHQSIALDLWIKH